MRFRLPKWFRAGGENAPVLDAMWEALQQTDPDGAAAMLYLARASGKHLDLHGALYGLSRSERENDASFRRRILAELLNPRSTAKAIKDVVEAALPGVRARVTTPVEDALTEGLRFIDYTWFLDGSYLIKQASEEANARAVFFVDIESDDPDLITARKVIERVRAAGTIPVVRFTFALEAVLEHEVFTYAQPFTFFKLDGARTLDGSWVLGPNATGPEEPLP